MSDYKLLPCPFCGHNASLENDGLSKVQTSSRPSACIGDYVTRWTVRCANCGTTRGPKSTSYIFGKDGNLKVVDGEDGRDEVIAAWNTRAQLSRQKGE